MKGKAQNVVIASRERETVPGCHTDNTSGANLIALLPQTDGPLGRSSPGYCFPRSKDERQKGIAQSLPSSSAAAFATKHYR